MANVFLTDEAYAKLKAAKKKGQSFSEVIVEKIEPRATISDIFGKFKGIDVEKIKAEIKKERLHK